MKPVRRGRCPWGWLPALAVTPGDGSHRCPVPPPPRGCAERPRHPLQRAVRAGGRSHHPPGARQGESTPLKTSRPVNVVTVSQGEPRGKQKRGPKDFPLSTLLLENVHILKYVYVPCVCHWVIFSPHILRILFWVVLAFGFVSFWAFFLFVF